jgi:uncharacterized RDD family membrane protein YckC
MRRSDETPDEPLLFDLPLEAPGRNAGSTRPASRTARRPLLDQEPDPGHNHDLEAIFDEAVEDTEDGDLHPSRDLLDGQPGASSRIAAGAADLLVHAAVGVGVLMGSRSMGIRLLLSDWPALAVFLLSFSFLYSVVPLAFWGQTPGMAWLGLSSRSRDGEPLAFDQTARRWLGGVITALLLGLPLLVSGRRRSLSDLLSGSETVSERVSEHVAA